jgi:shikimate kinase
VAERLLLVGMMGAGKSTVARLAAARLGWAWVDTDTEVARTAGASIPDLFARHGEPAFRLEESRVLADVLRGDGPLVVSVGGGAVLDEANRAAMRAAGTVVWLRARPETLIETAPAVRCSWATDPRTEPTPCAPSMPSDDPSTPRWPTRSSTSTILIPPP